MKYLIILKADNRPARMDVFESVSDAKSLKLGKAKINVYNPELHYIAEFEDSFDFTIFNDFYYIETDQDTSELVTDFEVKKIISLKTAKEIYSDIFDYYGANYIVNVLKPELTPFFDTCIRQESENGFLMAKSEIDLTELTEEDKNIIKGIIDGA